MGQVSPLCRWTAVLSSVALSLSSITKTKSHVCSLAPLPCAHAHRHRLTVTIMDDLANNDEIGSCVSGNGEDDEGEVNQLECISVFPYLVMDDLVTTLS